MSEGNLENGIRQEMERGDSKFTCVRNNLLGTDNMERILFSTSKKDNPGKQKFNFHSD